MLDPLNPFADAFAAPGFTNNTTIANQRAPSPQPPPLSPEDTATILDKIGAAGLGGLSFVGGILNKPGRIIRGLLGGAPREALNAIPFSDALGITKPEDEVRGTDLLDKIGITNKDDEDPGFFSPKGLAGFGVDVLTDPLTYMSFGGHALSKLGVAAKQAGMIPKTIAERAAGLSGSAADALAGKLGMESSQVAGKALGGHIGVGLPFMGNAATFDLAPLGNAVKRGVEALPGGSAVTGALGTLGKAAGDFYTATVPPLFQSSVAGRTTAAGQDIARNITERMPEVLAKSREEILPFARQASEQGLGTAAASDAMRAYAETGLGAPEIAKVVDPVVDLMKQKQLASREMGLHAPDLMKQEIRAGQTADEEIARKVLAATNPGALTPIAPGADLGHFPRQTIDTPDQLIQRRKNLAPQDAEQRLRSFTGLTTGAIKDIADPLNDLNQLHPLERVAAGMDKPAVLTDPAHQALWQQMKDNPDLLKDVGAKATMNPLQRVQSNIENRYLNMESATKKVTDARAALEHNTLANYGVVDDNLANKVTVAEAEKAALRRQAQDLAEMKVGGRMPDFGNHALADAANNITRHNVNFMKAEETYKGLGKIAGPAGKDTVPVMDVINKLFATSDTIGDSAVNDAGKFLGYEPPTGARIQMEKALKDAGFKGALHEAHIPASVAEDVAGLAGMGSIKGLSKFGEIWDNVTNLTKAFQTFTPSTPIRNKVQDIYNKIVYNRIDPNFSALDPRRVSGPLADAYELMNGRAVPGIAEKLKNLEGFSGLTDAEASTKFHELAHTWDVTREGFKRTAIKEGADVIGPGGVAGRGLESLLPQTEQKGMTAAYVGGLREGSFKPKDAFKVAGVGGSTEDVFAPVKAMRAANNANDNLMRYSSFLAGAYQGEAPAEAFANTIKAHYDFGNLSEFERKVMRRAVPFYSWARQNIPAVVDEIATNPGGKLATTIKGVERAKGEHPGLTPDYIREGVAAPVGAEEDGSQRYLSHLGLGFEDLGQLLGPGGPLGMLNPLIKAPIEQATGRQLFTGRDLRDLHSRIGDLTGQPLPTLENIAMNSPAGRTLSILGTAADPRKSILDKAVNLGTGARLQDVNVGQSRMAALRDYLQNNLRGPAFRHFDELSVRPENLPLLSPEEMNLYRLYRSLSQKGSPTQGALNGL